MSDTRPDRGGGRASAADLRSVLPFLAAGLILRLLWLHAANGLTTIGAEEAGEATRVAMSVSLGHGFADAFPGMGATAHMLPLTPLIAGGVIRLFGGAGPTAAVALTIWAFAQVGAGYLLIGQLFRELGMPPQTCRLGLAMLCLLPVFAPEETISFRYWEGALAVCLGAVTLTFLLRLRRRDTVRYRDLAAAAALVSCCFFISPAVGVASGACWTLFAVTRLSGRHAHLFGIATIAAFALWVVPWTVRNIEVLGAPIVVRSNFGLELAIANHAAAAAPGDPAVVFMNRLQAVHPYHGLRPYRTARAMGEVAYSKAVGQAAEAWIAAHPLQFLMLCARHYRQFFLPEPWQFGFSQSDLLSSPRSLAIGLVAIAGAISLCLGIRRRRVGYGTLALYLILVGAPYCLVQPVPRYSYLVYGLLCFLAADLIVGVTRRFTGPAERRAARAR